MTNYANTIVPIDDIWNAHIRPLLRRRGWSKTRARLRRVSLAQYTLDPDFSTPWSERARWETRDRNVPGASNLYRDLAALEWPQFVTPSYGPDGLSAVVADSRSALWNAEQVS